VEFSAVDRDVRGRWVGFDFWGIRGWLEHDLILGVMVRAAPFGSTRRGGSCTQVGTRATKQNPTDSKSPAHSRHNRVHTIKVRKHTS
jgi:hypothetical protein